MKHETFSCDIDHCKNEAVYKDMTLQVIFTTDQTEGRSTDHHLSVEDVDLCKDCLEHIIKGNYVYGAGAQGYNTYWFENKIKGKTK